jgi:hypothetical protein
MKTRIFLVAMALVVFASLSFGQGFCRQMYNTDNPLMNNCDGSGGPVPDGVIVYIYWDNDGNGPDADDPLATEIPQPCVVNYNSFPINGEAALGIPGGFVTDIDFCSAGCMPAPSTFFLRLTTPTGTTWESAATTFTVGPDVYGWHDWPVCVPGTPQCDPPQPGTIQISAQGGGDPQSISVCIPLCAAGTTVISICAADGHPLNPAFPPVSSWHPGCDYPCDVPCQPGDAIVTGPVYNPATGCFDYLIVGIIDNTCFCFTFERFLAAEFNSDFEAVARDNAVALSWSTAAETGLVRYDIVRDGTAVGRVDATNGSSRHEYTYVDETAVNGTTYTYELVSVGINNEVTTLATASATPSFNAAVITEYALHQNFPNPFNPTTQIAFDVLNTNAVTLKIYNAAGQEVATLVNGATYEGGKRYVMNFDATNLTSGLYFYSVKIGSEFSATKKMLLVK